MLSEDERHTLENWVKRRSTAQGLALRARTDAQVEEVVVRTLEELPEGATHWAGAGAGQTGGHVTVQRAADLAGVRAAALAHGGLQDLPGPAAHR